MTDQTNAIDSFSNAVYDHIIEQIFQPAAAGESVSDYFARVGIDPKQPPIEFMKVLDRMEMASVQLSNVNVWVIAMRFTAILFAMRDTETAQIAIKEIAKGMPEFPFEQLMDQPPTAYAKDVLHPDSAEQKAMEKLDVLLGERLSKKPVLHAGPDDGSYQKPLRQILHVQVGDGSWQPNSAELLAITDHFQSALLGKNGGIVATRAAVNTNLIETSIDPSGLIVSVSSRTIEEVQNSAAMIPAVGTVPSEVMVNDRELIRRTWELYKDTRNLPCMVAIDETGFFDVDADGNRFPLYVATPLGREASDEK